MLLADWLTSRTGCRRNNGGGGGAVGGASAERSPQAACYGAALACSRARGGDAEGGNGHQVAV